MHLSSGFTQIVCFHALSVIHGKHYYRILEIEDRPCDLEVWAADDRDLYMSRSSAQGNLLMAQRQGIDWLHFDRRASTARADTRAPTTWSLGVVAFKLFVFCQPSCHQGSYNNPPWCHATKLDSMFHGSATPSGQVAGARVSSLSWFERGPLWGPWFEWYHGIRFCRGSLRKREVLLWRKLQAALIVHKIRRFRKQSVSRCTGYYWYISTCLSSYGQLWTRLRGLQFFRFLTLTTYRLPPVTDPSSCGTTSSFSREQESEQEGRWNRPEGRECCGS